MEIKIKAPAWEKSNCKVKRLSKWKENLLNCDKSAMR